ncbi:MAG TPA: hypothetical protein VFP05_07830 [Thermomicrobiales bacterium]|nr:hypothetical protein [Thermomicrobiales bacterium]
MGGHDVFRATVVAREQAYERDRKIERRRQIQEAMATDPARIGKVTWFEGVKATARFLSDSVQEAIAQRRMTEARG